MKFKAGDRVLVEYAYLDPHGAERKMAGTVLRYIVEDDRYPWRVKLDEVPYETYCAMEIEMSLLPNSNDILKGMLC